jgi:hypothetical protein
MDVETPSRDSRRWWSSVEVPPPARRVLERALPFWFAAISATVAFNTIAGQAFGLDTRIYRLAAIEALAGGDPWAVRYGPYEFLFGGPPPTVVASLPLAVLPEGAAVAIWAAVLVGAAFATVRLLRLPLWWVLFPPVVDSVLVGNPDVLVVALLASGARLAGGVAPLFKVYAMVPLVVLGRWRALLVAAILVALSLPLWAVYLPQAGAVTEMLRAQSLGGFSAFGTVLLIPTLLALALLPRRTAAWLIVPAAWPWTQFHYACLAIPALGLVSGYLMAIPLRGMPALVVMGMALIALVRAIGGRDETGLNRFGRALVGRWRRTRPGAPVIEAGPQTAA